MKGLIVMEGKNNEMLQFSGMGGDMNGMVEGG